MEKNFQPFLAKTSNSPFEKQVILKRSTTQADARKVFPRANAQRNLHNDLRQCIVERRRNFVGGPLPFQVIHDDTNHRP